MERERINPFIDIYEHMTVRERQMIRGASMTYGLISGLVMGGAIVGPVAVMLTFHQAAWGRYTIPIVVTGAVAIVVAVSGIWRWQKSFYASSSWAQSQGYTVRDFRRSDAISAAVWSMGNRGSRDTSGKR